MKLGRGRIQQRIGEGVTSSTGVGDVVEVTLLDNSKQIGKLVGLDSNKLMLETGGKPVTLWLSQVKHIGTLESVG